VGRIRELDGWRAIAASMVIVQHILSDQHAHSLSRFPLLASAIGHMGYLGVQIFFVISGFVICRLLLREEERYGFLSLKGFYIRRGFRILPPLYIYLATVALLARYGLVNVTGWQIAKAALFLVDFHSYSAPWLTGHSWSLSVEEQFYLFFPAILWLTARRWRHAVCGTICALCIAVTLVIAHRNQPIPLISTGVMGGFVCIFCGVLIGLQEKKARFLAKKAPITLILLAAAVLFLHPFGNPDDWKDALYETVAVPPLIALILLSTIERNSWVQSFLCSRPIQAVGITSYALYLWQQLFTGKSDSYHGVGHFIPFFLPALFIIIPASWFLVEKPAMRLGRRLSSRLRAAESSSTPTEQLPA
jgi:peptidoglycan/LPS O-acetylase OafA/YrhL